MQLCTLKSAAAKLAVTRKTLYTLHSKGQLEFVKIGKATRVTVEELERFVKANADGTRQPAPEATEQETQGDL